MKTIVWIFGYLSGGAGSVAIVMYLLTVTMVDNSGLFDLTPILGLVIGGPIWLLAFPLSFIIFKQQTPNFYKCFGCSFLVSGVFAVGIPFLLVYR